MVQRKYDSFAIGALNNENTDVQIELSVNVWVDVKQSSEIDFGVKIPHDDHVRGFFIFAPFEFCSTDVVDLSQAFRDAGFNQILFNRDCETAVRLDQTIVTDAEGGSILVVPLSTLGGPTVERVSRGTLLSVSFDPSIFPDDQSSLYFRIRAPYTPLDCLLSGPVDIKEAVTDPIIPFRAMSLFEINQVRGLPDAVARRLVESGTVLREIHIAVVAPKQWKVDSSHAPYRIRLLEKMSWDCYQPRLREEEGVHLCSAGVDRFVYQWLLAEGNSSLQLEFTRKRITVSTVLIYLTILFLLNLLSEILIRIIL